MPVILAAGDFPEEMVRDHRSLQRAPPINSELLIPRGKGGPPVRYFSVFLRGSPALEG